METYSIIRFYQDSSWSKLLKENPTCVDLFCGCGGLSLGFSLAGFQVLCGLDNDPDSIMTYNRNFPGQPGMCRDIKQLTKASIKKALPPGLRVDVLIGGPPCQGFSQANQWSKAHDDPRNELMLYFAEQLEFLRPRMFLIENVKGIMSPAKRHIKDSVIEMVTKKGYEVWGPKVLNASEFGVPQKRERAFIVGWVKGLSFQWPESQSGSSVTVKEAISDLYAYEDKHDDAPVPYCSQPQSTYQRKMRKGSKLLHNHEARMPASVTQEKISHVPQGGNWRDIPAEIIGSLRTNRHSSAFRRLHEDLPSITVDTGNSHSNYFHPIANRIPSVREAARLQSFPDRFKFEGTRGSQYRQVGNAVPPLLAEALGCAFLRSLRLADSNAEADAELESQLNW